MLRSRAFTLIELLVTIVILAILSAMAMPAFTSMIQSHRSMTVSEELTTAIQLARSEALKRRKNVIICRSNDAQDDCEDGDDWSNGWLIRQAAGDVIRVWEPSTTTTVAGPNGGLTFQSSGLSSASGTFDVEVSGCADGKKRTITVSATGNATHSQSTCTPSS
ncbi:GspH/FimT family pseudopilin [Pseudomonas turukhanskensis]|uniref:Type II secretion system protein H n=1 Tax=Pseudomonas turukhanskensis TaxID=1806536 RepID=A0A9W6K8G4_9PSED|nr:GspH/FimT family pseudopilin [Pseudomonas turukhanskensis]GLK90722.1 pre-pilin like leader sequence [Pseudomonas turukhanskensis]